MLKKATSYLSFFILLYLCVAKCRKDALDQPIIHYAAHNCIRTFQYANIITDNAIQCISQHTCVNCLNKDLQCARCIADYMRCTTTHCDHLCGRLNEPASTLMASPDCLACKLDKCQTAAQECISDLKSAFEAAFQVPAAASYRPKPLLDTREPDAEVPIEHMAPLVLGRMMAIWALGGVICSLIFLRCIACEKSSVPLEDDDSNEMTNSSSNNWDAVSSTFHRSSPSGGWISG